MFCNKRTLTTLAGAAGLALASSTAPASAYIFDFVSVAEGTGSNPSGFSYSYWHAATSNGGKSGDIIAVFGDAPGGATTNTFNPISGTYNTNNGIVTNLTMTIYAPTTPTIGGQTVADPTNPVGVVTFNGAMGNLGSWNQNNGATQGFLNFTATFFDNSNSVYSFLTGNGFTGVDNGNGTYSVSDTHYFNDTFYMGAANGPTTNDPNSIDVDEGSDLLDPSDNSAIMVLWGGSLANANARDGNNGYVHSNTNTTLGIDLWLDMDYGGGGTSIPETTSLALFGLGLVGFGVAARRRRK